MHVARPGVGSYTALYEELTTSTVTATATTSTTTAAPPTEDPMAEAGATAFMIVAFGVFAPCLLATLAYYAYQEHKKMKEAKQVNPVDDFFMFDEPERKEDPHEAMKRTFDSEDAPAVMTTSERVFLDGQKERGPHSPGRGLPRNRPLRTTARSGSPDRNHWMEDSRLPMSRFAPPLSPPPLPGGFDFFDPPALVVDEPPSRWQKPPLGEPATMAVMSKFGVF